MRLPASGPWVHDGYIEVYGGHIATAGIWVIGPTGLRGWQGSARRGRDKAAIRWSERATSARRPTPAAQACLCVRGRPGRPAAEVPYGLFPLDDDHFPAARDPQGHPG